MTISADLLGRIPAARIAVIGDFCLDAYWDIDLSVSEPSLETERPTRPIRAQRYAPGGAGNVLANIASLGVRQLYAFGIVGPDPFGRCLIDIIRATGASVDGLLAQPENWQTHVFAKPHIDGVEQDRLDFGVDNELATATEEAIVEQIRKCLGDIDLFVVSQQVKNGIWTDRFRLRMQGMISEHPGISFLVDGRDITDEMSGVYRKFNEQEASRCLAELCDGNPDDEKDIEDLITELQSKLGGRVCITRGQDGAMLTGEGKLERVMGLDTPGPLDIVGAGDSFLGGMAAALAIDATFRDACELGNLCAAVTIRKTGQTGTATPQEVLRLIEDVS